MSSGTLRGAETVARLIARCYRTLAAEGVPAGQAAALTIVHHQQIEARATR